MVSRVPSITEHDKILSRFHFALNIYAFEMFSTNRGVLRNLSYYLIHLFSRNDIIYFSRDFLSNDSSDMIIEIVLIRFRLNFNMNSRNIKF